MPRSLLHALARRDRERDLGPNPVQTTDQRPRRPGGRYALLLGAALLVSILSGPPATASKPILLGSGGDAAWLADLVDEPLFVHRYGKLSGTVPVGKMLNLSPGVTWQTIISAKPGSQVYNNLVRWADTIKARGTTTLVAFSHEPEAQGSSWLGTPAEFIGAFRKFRTVFESRGVRNVEYTWQMTAYSFRVPPTDPRYYMRWYPGDTYVDNVAVDAYNWYNCEHGTGVWKDLDILIDPAVQFARKKGKQFVLGEFSSQSDPRRAQWISNAEAYFEANRDTVHAVFWFQRVDEGHADCRWPITSTPDIKAYKAMAEGPIFSP